MPSEFPDPWRPGAVYCEASMRPSCRHLADTTLGCTAFYSDDGPGAQIFIGAPFSWDHVRAGAEGRCIGCSSQSRVRDGGNNLPASRSVASGRTRVESSPTLTRDQ